MSDSEAMAERSVPDVGRVYRIQAFGKAPDDQNLSAEGEKDSCVSVDVRIAIQRFCFKTLLVELRRLFRIARVDMNMIE